MYSTKFIPFLLILCCLSLAKTIQVEAHDDNHTHSHDHLNSPHTNTTTVGANLTDAKPVAVPPNSSAAFSLVDGIKTIIDLSHPLTNSTLHWPTNFGFEHITLKDGEFPNDKNVSHYLLSDGFRTAVHSGTHLDAPRHFSKTSWTVDHIPLERLIDVPVSIIDVSEKVKLNRSYTFHVSDFQDAKTGQSLVLADSVVLVFTNISGSYDEGAKAYFGTNSTNISEMSIPGLSKEAAEFLVEKKVFGFGLDAPSADSSIRHGINNTYDPVAHSILCSNNIYILENISNNLKKLVNTSAHLRLIISPLPIVGGSGSPVRLVAMTAHDDCAAALTNSTFSAKYLLSPILSIMVGALFVYNSIKVNSFL